MKDLTTLTKIILGALGIYLLIRLIPNLITGLYMPFSSYVGFPQVLLSFLGIGFLLAWGGVVLWFFIRKREWLTRLILKGISEPAEISGPVDWIAFGYRIVCFIAGLILISASAAQIAHLLFFVVLLWMDPDYTSQAGVFLRRLGGLAVPLALGIYLTIGAPGFLQWQTRRTHAMMREAS